VKLSFGCFATGPRRVNETVVQRAVWERPDLERLYARLQEEYELKERAEALSRKLAVISNTAEVLNRYDRHQAFSAAGANHRDTDPVRDRDDGYELLTRR
jgi:acyl-CoA synthetase (NDP forming)